ncbi:hypothetical protein [Streptomyces mirabilis]|uniref:hypothetical protein n=1 Tax=Streptomyces mirabilis TaxID=68239 RepID=UPI0035E18327
MTVQPRGRESGGQFWTRRFPAVPTIAGLFDARPTLALREAREKAGLPPPVPRQPLGRRSEHPVVLLTLLKEHQWVAVRLAYQLKMVW